MKININQIPAEGLILEQKLDPQELVLETEITRFPESVKVKTKITKITNTVTVDFDLNTKISIDCSRCLDEFEIDFKKTFQLSYPVDKSGTTIDLDPDIREEIILEYPIKPLCRSDCKGLCPKCGKNLNEGNCNCVR